MEHIEEDPLQISVDYVSIRKSNSSESHGFESLRSQIWPLVISEKWTIFPVPVQVNPSVETLNKSVCVCVCVCSTVRTIVYHGL